MLAELGAIEDPRTRRRFAVSATVAVVRQELALLAVVSSMALLVAAMTLTASRWQLADGGPGVLAATVPGPALPLLAVGFWAAWWRRSVRAGLEAGAFALAAGFAGLVVVLAVEGQLWMQRNGVFMLDGDPPRQPVGPVDVALDLFSTGMWVGHVIFWLPWPVIGAHVGGRLAAVRDRRSGGVASPR